MTRGIDKVVWVKDTSLISIRFTVVCDFKQKDLRVHGDKMSTVDDYVYWDGYLCREPTKCRKRFLLG